MSYFKSLLPKERGREQRGSGARHSGEREKERERKNVFPVEETSNTNT